LLYLHEVSQGLRACAFEHEVNFVPLQVFITRLKLVDERASYIRQDFCLISDREEHHFVFDVADFYHQVEVLGLELW